MKNASSRYESLLIFSSDYSPKQLRFLAYYYANTIREWGGSKIHVRYRGKRNLTYEIKGSKIGDYIEIRFNLLPAALELYQSLIKLDDQILRSFIKKKS
uniref:Ribosomal protein S6 n=1 Tax=Pseudellipsoidion edaphicum TaxID=1431838 RepID=A0A3R5QP41_9STRA|nr:ribosomal protein S6 [Pseudellipsoidion edaphicum]QAA12028.1 ribosomal protein S6 [Pseudellipsoidion edaphicum]